MSKKIAIINLKGGVGKSTLTYGLSMALAYAGKRVLVFDLDPQANSSILFLGNNAWDAINPHKTLVSIFRQELEEKRDYSITDNVIIEVDGNISNLKGKISIVSSSPELMDIQDRLPLMKSGNFFLETPVNIIQRYFQKYFDNYDYVFFDCPPSLGLIPMNALLICDDYIIPTIPDRVSTSGIKQVIGRIKVINSFRQNNIILRGIVISKYRVQDSLHVKVIKELENEYSNTIIKPYIIESKDISSLGDFGSNTFTFAQKFCRSASVFMELKNVLYNSGGFYEQ